MKFKLYISLLTILLITNSCDLSKGDEGIASSPKLAIEYSGKEITTSDIEVYKFKDTYISETTNTKNLYIKNIGTSNLVIDNILMLSPDNSFSLLTPNTKTIAPGKKVEITVQFKPNSTENQNGTISIYSNDPSNIFNFNFIGKGVVLYKPIISGTELTDNLKPLWSWEVPQNVQSIFYRLNQSPWIETTDTSRTTFSPETNLNAGEQIFDLKFKFNSGEYSDISSFITFIYASNDLPVVSGSSITNSRTLLWTWTIPQNSIKQRYKVNDDNWQEITDMSVNSLEYLTNLEGINRFTVEVLNSTGQWISSLAYETLVDTIAPNAPRLMGDQITKLPRPTWTWNSVNDYDKVKYKINNENWITVNSKITSITPDYDLLEGQYMITVKFGDTAENWSTESYFETTVDYNAFEQIRISGQNVTNSSPIVWTWTIPSGTNKIRYRHDNNSWIETTDLRVQSYSISGNTLKDYRVYVEAADENGNWFSSQSFTTTFDNKPPQYPTSTTNVLQKLKRPRWSWTTTSDVTQVQYKVNNGIWKTVSQNINNYVSETDLPEGENILYVKLGDLAENWTPELRMVITTDITPPVVQNISGLDLTNNPIPTWSWDWSPYEDIREVQYRLLSNEWITIPHNNNSRLTYRPFADLPHGIYNFEVRIQDNAGNWSDIKSYRTDVDRLPPTPPELIGPRYTKNNKPEFKYIISSDTVEINYNYTTSTGTISGSPSIDTHDTIVPLRPMSEGDNIVKIRAKDVAGNWSEFNVHTVTIDNIAPAKGVITGDATTNNKRPIWTITAPSDLHSVSYRINNSPWKEVIGNTITPDSDLTDGQKTIEVIVIDEAGNRSIPATFITTIDTQGPAQPYLYGTSTPTINKFVSWQWRLNSDVNSYKYRLNNGAWNLVTSSDIEFSSESYRTELGIGSHTFDLIFMDMLGNESAMASRTIDIVINNTPPEAPTIASVNSYRGSDQVRRIEVIINDNSINEDGFVIEKKIGDNGAFVPVKTIRGADLSFIDEDNLIELEKYTYRVKAYNQYGDSPYSPEVSYICYISPPNFSRTTLIDNTSDYGLKLEWQDNSTVGTGYNLYRKDVISGSYLKIGSFTKTTHSYIDRTVPEFGNVFYKISTTYPASGAIRESEHYELTAHYPSLRAPLDLSITEMNSNIITLKWIDKSNTETGYRIYRKRTGWQITDTYQLIDTLPANTTQFSDNVTVYDQYNSILTYEYKVEAFKTYINTDFISDPITIDSANFVLKPVSSFQAEANGTNIKLSWRADSPEFFTGYKLTVSTSPGDTTEVITITGNWSGYELNNLQEATKYTFNLCKTNGGIISQAKSATAVTSIAPPTNLTLLGKTATSVSLGWQPSPNQRCSYIIKRREVNNPSVVVTLGLIGDTTYIDSTVAPDTMYEYSVAAEYFGEESAPLLLLVSTSPKPLKPSNSNIQPLNSGTDGDRIVISWDKVTDATGYNIVKYHNNTKISEHNLQASESRYIDKAITPGEVYRYVLKAVNSSGESDPTTLETTALPLGSVNLTNNANWNSGFLTVDSEVHWFYIYAEKGVKYNIYSDDKLDGSGNTTADIQMTITHKNINDYFYYNYDGSFLSPLPIDSTLTEVIFIKVEGKSSRERGTYSIKITRS